VLREHSKGFYIFFGKKLLNRNSELVDLTSKFESAEKNYIEGKLADAGRRREWGLEGGWARDFRDEAGFE
jgi:hypothetical protein